MMSSTTATTTTPRKFLSIEQELGQLFNTIQFLWNTHPNRFGYKLFDEFLKSLPNSYYYLINYQKKLQIQQQQKFIPSTSSTPIKPSVPSPPSPPSKPSIPCTPKAKIASIAKKRVKRSCFAAPKLQSIDEENTLSKSSTSSITTPCSLNEDKLNAFAAEFVPTPNIPKPIISDNTNKTNITSKTYKKLNPFIPAHAARAKLNIYIPKHMTKKLLASIDEKFPNTGTLYYYLDISTALQINDEQVDIIQTVDGEKLALINFDLHKKGTKELLLAVIIANDQHKIEANKWLWKLDEFLTIKEIQCKYGIDIDGLPQSSRLTEGGLYSQWKVQKDKIIDMNILNEVNWSENILKQIGSSQKGKKAKKTPEIKIILNENHWINECRKSWNVLPAIPIVVYENRDINKHWIEWIKLIYIESQNAYIGISCKYNHNDNQWKVGSICLDKGDMHNKHRLIGLNYNHQSKIDYDAYFQQFNTKITEIQWKL